MLEQPWGQPQGIAPTPASISDCPTGMTFDRNIHHRKSIRLKNYDYAQAGMYFVTICTQNHVTLFGDIIDNAMAINAAGIMVVDQWQMLGNRFPSIKLHEYVVMPNHFHGIIEIIGANPGDCPDGCSNCANIRGSCRGNPLWLPRCQGQVQDSPLRLPPTVGDIVGAFKSLSTRGYIHHVKHHNWPPFSGKLWQRNYYEHIIRNEATYLKIADYIQTNPQRWREDIYYV